MMILPNGDRYGVIPVDNPTVPKAEVTSKSILINPNFSVIDNKKVDKKIKKIEAVKIKYDFFTVELSTHLS